MNELFNKLPKLKKNINLTKDTLNKFYKNLQNEKDKINDSKYKYKCTPITFLGEYPRDLQIPPIPFVDSEICSFLNKSSGFYQQFKINIFKRHFTIHLYLPSQDYNSRDDDVGHFFQECVYKIQLWLCFVSPYIKNQCSMKTTIYLLFTHFQKLLPQKNEPITTKHVNSGFTETSYNNESSIYIFRYEEWFKVLIHESFHCFGLDFSRRYNSVIKDKITEVFKVENKNGIKLYEAYCEIWAEVLNVVFVSYFKTKDKNSFLITFDFLLNKELSFTAYQCNKILKHLRISYDDMINLNCRTIKIRETTNMTSYYFLKFILFLNLRKFESWCKKHNTTLFEFNKNNMLKFVDFIIQHSRDELIQKSFERMDVFNTRATLSSYEKKTMKMTIVNY